MPQSEVHKLFFKNNPAVQVKHTVFEDDEQVAQPTQPTQTPASATYSKKKL